MLRDELRQLDAADVRPGPSQPRSPRRPRGGRLDREHAGRGPDGFRRADCRDHRGAGLAGPRPRGSAEHPRGGGRRRARAVRSQQRPSTTELVSLFLSRHAGKGSSMDGRRTALIVASDEFEHAGLSRLHGAVRPTPRRWPASSATRRSAASRSGSSTTRRRTPSRPRSRTCSPRASPTTSCCCTSPGTGSRATPVSCSSPPRNTRPDRLASTAVSADFVQRCMRGSRARSIVLFLDCCYGGAFSEGVAVRAAGPGQRPRELPCRQARRRSGPRGHHRVERDGVRLRGQRPRRPTNSGSPRSSRRPWSRVSAPGLPTVTRTGWSR